MIEFISEWWFLLVLLAVFVVYAIYIASPKAQTSVQKHESFTNSNPGWFLGCVILSGLVIPQIYYDQIAITIGEKQLSFIYFLYLAGVLISSHYFKKNSYFFVFISNLVILSCWPRTEKMPLYMAYFIVLMSVIFYIVGIS